MSTLEQNQIGTETDDDLTTACPTCDSTKLYRRSRSIQRKAGEYEHTWRCESCGERFDEPTVRKRKHNAINFESGSLADKLYRADPDEVSR
jgi:transposase-like protein